MSIQQLKTTVPIWHNKPALEKLIAKVVLNLAAVAAGDSGFHWAGSAGNQGQLAIKDCSQ